MWASSSDGHRLLDGTYAVASGMIVAVTIDVKILQPPGDILQKYKARLLWVSGSDEYRLMCGTRSVAKLV